MHFLFNAKQTQSAENTLCPYSEGKLDEYEISILVTLQISQRKTTMANQYKLILKKKKTIEESRVVKRFLAERFDTTLTAYPHFSDAWSIQRTCI